MKEFVILCCVLSCTVTAFLMDNQGPIFIREPPAQVHFANSTGARVDCVAQGSPTPDIRWVSSDGKPVGQIPNLRDVFPNGTLAFLPFQPSSYRQDVHAATYRCVAVNLVGKVISRNVQVRAVVMQYYELQVYNQNVLRGNTASLRCNVPSFVRDFITIESWIQDSIFNIYPSATGDGKYHMLPSGELHIRNVDSSDSYRTYQCRGVHSLTGEMLLSSTRGRITVREPRENQQVRVMEKLSNIKAKKDQLIVLPCIAEGYPPPTYKWYRQGLHPVEDDDRMFQVGGSLAITHVSEEDGGRYVCVVNNTGGVDRAEVNLMVSVSLSALVQPQHVTVDLGRLAELNCMVSGQPLTSVYWVKDGQLVRGGDRVRILGSEKLLVDPVQREDGGMYQCFVKNEEEMAQATSELKLGAAYPQLTYKFIQQTLQPGPPVSLKCIATGSPTPYIKWTLDGFPLPSSERFLIGQYVLENGDVISHINISRVEVQDGGNYQCTAVNRAGEATHSADLRVYGLPFIRPMPSISAVAGETLIVTCPVAGYPIDKITWEKGGRLLPVNRRQRVFQNGTLVMENVQRVVDRGSYSCSANNKQGYTATQSVEISVIVPPKIGPFTFGELVEGVRTQVQCVVQQGDLPLSLRWLKDYKTIPDGVGIEVKEDEYSSTLVIPKVSAKHTGNYTCVATNPAKEERQTAELVVSVPPTWLSEPHDRNVTLGNPVYLHCQAKGFPEPSVTWRKAVGRQLNEYQDLNFRTNRNLQLMANGTLFIPRAEDAHRGVYLCEATNGIGAGLSAVVNLAVLVPAYFETKSAQESVRRGSPATLQCLAKGDEPMKVSWQKEGSNLALRNDPRFSMKESVMNDGLLAELHIDRTIKEDNGPFLCIASNPFGRDQRTVLLLVQDAPSPPRDVRMVDVGSRYIKITWLAPAEETKPILKNVVQYKVASETWHEHVRKITVESAETGATVQDLRPATVYHVRVLAENQFGASEASDVLSVRTEAEVPSGVPRSVEVEALASNRLKVVWAPLERDTWNGDILGYYVGYRIYGISRPGNYNFTTISLQGDKHGLLVLDGLGKFTKYGIVIQAFNDKGAGPMSEEVLAQTLEDVPGAPPVDIRCAALTSQSIQVSWQPPPYPLQNGNIQGYKVYYENMEDWPGDVIEAETKVTTAQTTVLHGLQKFSNYSVQVLAFTRVGDGIRSKSIFCQTDEDVPDAPSDIKATVSSPASVVVSWVPPTRANGAITLYNVYIRVLENGREENIFKRTLPPMQNYYEAQGLKKRETYEFWVTASTQIGEGKSTRVVSTSPTTEVPSSITSFGQTLIRPWRDDVNLHCHHVGIPQPQHEWKGPDNHVIREGNERIQLNADGSLLIHDLHKSDAGNYTCSVRNEFGKDAVQYTIKVQVPPSPPLLHVTSSSSTSLQLHWKQGDNGGSTIRGFLLNYKREQGEWEEVSIERTASTFTLSGLACGCEYFLHLLAFNSIGSSGSSETIQAKTKGSRPQIPSQDSFVDPNVTFATLYMSKWQNPDCPMTTFTIDYREKNKMEWIMAGNNVQSLEPFPLVGLWPGVSYVLQITAQNSAGTTVAKYDFSTLSLAGGTGSPSLVMIAADEEVPLYKDVSVIASIVISCIALLTVTLAVCFCLKRKPAQDHPVALQETQSVAMENKQNLAQREQYYAAVQKGIPMTVRDDRMLEQIPESSTSNETSPLPDKRFFPRKGRPRSLLMGKNNAGRYYHSDAYSLSSMAPSEETSFGYPSHIEPPTGFSDGHELSEAECDMADTLRHLKRGSHSPFRRSRAGFLQDYTIAV